MKYPAGDFSRPGFFLFGRIAIKTLLFVWVDLKFLIYDVNTGALETVVETAAERPDGK